MKLTEIQANLSKQLDELFCNLDHRGFVDFPDNKEEEVEGYFASLINWIDNFEWDGELRKIE